MNYRVITWITENYQEVLNEYLKPSLDKLADLDYKVYYEKNTNNWQKNTNLKPFIVEKALNDTDKSILVLDADSRLYDYPKLLDEIPEEYDCALFYLKWAEWYRNGSTKEELCSGTLFFRNREICIDLIKLWQEECKRNRYADQRNLEEAIKKLTGTIKIYKLPYEYCWIHDMPNGKEPLIPKPKNIIIEHFQVSRYMRNKIR